MYQRQSKHAYALGCVVWELASIIAVLNVIGLEDTSSWPLHVCGSFCSYGSSAVTSIKKGKYHAILIPLSTISKLSSKYYNFRTVLIGSCSTGGFPVIVLILSVQ